VNRIRQKFTTFTQQSRLSQVLLVPAWCLTGIARAMVLLLPFKWFAPGLGLYCGVAAFLPLAETRQYQTALSIGRAVRMAATISPWDANCQAQAIAARRSGQAPDPLSLHFPNATDGLQGIRFVTAALASSHNNSAWVSL